MYVCQSVCCLALIFFIAVEYAKWFTLVRKCPIEDCTREFTSGHELLNHKMECHNISFKCVPCNRKFKWKRSFVRHSRECRNASPIYNCSKCDFFSFRKFSLERHTVDIHDGKKTEKVDNAMERSAERTHMSSSQEFSCLFIGGDKKIYAYRFNDKNKS